MEIFRTIKYRLLPTEEQEKKLLLVCAASREVYNAANQQRFMYGRSKKDGPDAFGREFKHSKFSQIKECAFKRMKAHSELSWIYENVPAHVVENAINDCDNAWNAYFSKLSENKKKGIKEKVSPPKFRSVKNNISFGMPIKCDSKDKLGNPVLVVKLKAGKIIVAEKKIGAIKYVRHQRLRLKSKFDYKDLTVKCENNQWFACISYVLHVDPPANKPQKAIGIDLGVTNPITLSDGTIFKIKKMSRKVEEETKSIMRSISRANVGQKRFQKKSNRYKKKLERLSEIRRQDAARKRAALHQISTELVNQYSHIGLEKLAVQEMTKSAKAVRKAGKKTESNKIKARYNKAFLAIPKYAFEQMLAYKGAAKSATVVTVDPAYTSQKCSSCGGTASQSRKKEKFVCVICGHADHADINAAKNIVRKAFPDLVGGDCEASLKTGRKVQIDASFDSSKIYERVLSNPARSHGAVGVSPQIFSNKNHEKAITTRDCR